MFDPESAMPALPRKPSGGGMSAMEQKLYNEMTGGDRDTHVRFYWHAVKNDTESEELGRPVYKDVPYIEFRYPPTKDMPQPESFSRAVSPDDQSVLYGRLVRDESDLMLIEGFR